MTWLGRTWVALRRHAVLSIGPAPKALAQLEALMADENTNPGERRSPEDDVTAQLIADLQVSVRQLRAVLDRLVAAGGVVTVIKTSSVGKSTAAHKIPPGDTSVAQSRRDDGEWR